VSTISFRGVSKSFGGANVVDSFDLEIASGEFVVLVGPSGCGKTTTLRILAGLEEASQGRIFLDGRDITDVHAKDRDLAMVFQSYALYPHKTVRENLAFALKLAKVAPMEIDRRVQEVSTALGLAELLDRRPKTLSGGQRQRVAVGRAIIRNPKAFLFDEPLSNLDAKLRVGMRSELIRLHQHLRATMVYVTHDQVEAMTMGDRIVIMRDGKIQQVGAPLEVYDNPVNVFVAGFIGSPAMNFVTGTASKMGDRVFLEFSGNRLEIQPAGGFEDGGRIIAGFRPEAIELNPAANEHCVAAKISTIEHLGAETIIAFDIMGMTILGRFPRVERLTLGERMNIAIAPRRILLFDADSQERIGV
jgi:multiple sugar transport system ATP-binding protein